MLFSDYTKILSGLKSFDSPKIRNAGSTGSKRSRCSSPASTTGSLDSPPAKVPLQDEGIFPATDRGDTQSATESSLDPIPVVKDGGEGRVRTRSCSRSPTRPIKECKPTITKSKSMPMATVKEAEEALTAGDTDSIRELTDTEDEESVFEDSGKIYSISANMRMVMTGELQLKPATWNSELHRWKQDNWDGLRNPPPCLTADHYLWCLPKDMNNSEALRCYMIAANNLAIARHRSHSTRQISGISSKKTSLKIPYPTMSTQSTPDDYSLPLNEIAESCKDLVSRLKDALDILHRDTDRSATARRGLGTDDLKSNKASAQVIIGETAEILNLLQTTTTPLEKTPTGGTSPAIHTPVKTVQPGPVWKSIPVARSNKATGAQPLRRPGIKK